YRGSRGRAADVLSGRRGRSAHLCHGGRAWLAAGHERPPAPQPSTSTAGHGLVRRLFRAKLTAPTAIRPRRHDGVVTRVFAVSGCLVAIVVIARRAASERARVRVSHRLRECPTRIQEHATDI